MQYCQLIANSIFSVCCNLIEIMAWLVNKVYRLTPLCGARCRPVHDVNTSKINAASSQNKSSVDDNDLHHLNSLADDWWSENGSLKALHTMNKLRVKLIVQGLLNVGRIDKVQFDKPEPLEGIRLLDVGCGGGILTEPLARLGASATGLDPGDALIRVAQLHAEKDPSLANHISYVHGTIEEHGDDNKEAYDVVVASEVIEHVSNREIFVESCVRAVKPGGSIFFTTLNKTFLSWFGGIILAEKVLHIAPNGTHQWEKFVSPEELESLLASHGCSTKVVHGMLFNPLTYQWSWTTATPISYALHAVKAEQ